MGVNRKSVNLSSGTATSEYSMNANFYCRHQLVIPKLAWKWVHSWKLRPFGGASNLRQNPVALNPKTELIHSASATNEN